MHCAKGETVRLEKHVHKLDQGIMGLGEHDENGAVIYTRLLFPGDLLSPDKRPEEDFFAITDVELSIPATYEGLNDSCRCQLERAARLTYIRSVSLEQRLARLLDLLAGEVGQKEEGGVVTLPLTQRQLADMIGAARESVAVALPKLLKKRHINSSRAGVRWKTVG